MTPPNRVPHLHVRSVDIDYKQLSADTNLTEQFFKEVIEAHADRHGPTARPIEATQQAPRSATVFELTRKREERFQAGS